MAVSVYCMQGGVRYNRAQLYQVTVLYRYAVSEYTTVTKTIKIFAIVICITIQRAVTIIKS